MRRSKTMKENSKVNKPVYEPPLLQPITLLDESAKGVSDFPPPPGSNRGGSSKFFD
jgi:hypothetical protein